MITYLSYLVIQNWIYTQIVYNFNIAQNKNMLIIIY